MKYSQLHLGEMVSVYVLA